MTEPVRQMVAVSVSGSQERRRGRDERLLQVVGSW